MSSRLVLVLALSTLVLGGACSADQNGGPGPRRDGGALRDTGAAASDGSTGNAGDATTQRDAAAPGADGSTSTSGDENNANQCNQLDDDGDGLVDEGCSCTPGETQPCWPGPMATRMRGACRDGVQGCDGSGEFASWTECVGATLPTTDVCGDRVDDDCNGTPDDGTACLCTTGQTRPCYTGPDGTRGVGICADGTESCDPTPGVGWASCVDDVLPRAEICGNGLDDDCNGRTDDGLMCACMRSTTRACYPGPRAEVGVGVCREGTQMCNAGGTAWSMCAGFVGPSTEVCADMLDNDCNGMTDDGCPTEVNVAVNLNGDCLTARCPATAPYPVGCDITMAGGDSRGCVASTPMSPVVYFQEGDACGAGRVTGSLRCSSTPGARLNATNCRINKSDKFYPTARSGCPAT